MRILSHSRWFLLAFLIIAIPMSSFAGVFISVGVAPPPLPVYEQPWCPGPGYLWTPGYWAYGPDGYFWVPGTWVEPPEVGFLWTPGYWGWGDSAFVWHTGYWGQQVGFYGGVNYGYGYTGNGYEGGRWRGRDFYYNRSVNRVNVTNIHNVYNTTVVNNTTVNRVSYNGGNGGVNARPNAAQEAALHERHVNATSVQAQHEQMARSDRSQWASVNRGRPEVAATPKPAAFHGAGVARASNPPVTNSPAVNAPRPGNNALRPGNASTANTPRPGNNGNNVPRPPERAKASNPSNAGAARPNTANNTPRPNNTVPHPPSNESRPNNAAAARPNNPTVSHNTGKPPSETTRQAPPPPAHVTQSESAPRGNSTANMSPHNNNASRPPAPARESAPRPNNAAAPRPANPNVAHSTPPPQMSRGTSPPAHQNQPAPHVSQPPAQHPAQHVSQPPAQHAAAPHQSAPHPPGENKKQ